ncbi:hypothetical protein OTK58_24065 [Vibrio barjaei]|nr:hypothetical protein [Vibrio barjaei]
MTTDANLANLCITILACLLMRSSILKKETDTIYINLNNYGPGLHANKIAAIQIIEKFVTQTNGRSDTIDGIFAYELNVRMKNGDRHCLLNHREWKAIKRDANTLQKHLHTPIETNDHME